MIAARIVHAFSSNGTLVGKAGNLQWDGEYMGIAAAHSTSCLNHAVSLGRP